jgi:hypothetical protein
MSISVSAPATMVGSRTGFLVVVAAATAAGFLASGGDAAAQAGAELTHLLRAMAVLKALMAGAAGAAVFWRLGSAIPGIRLAAYALAVASMGAGVGLVWGIAHVVAGAVLLHGGLLATLLLLWRDPEVGHRLGVVVAARRARLRAG